MDEKGHGIDTFLRVIRQVRAYDTMGISTEQWRAAIGAFTGGGRLRLNNRPAPLSVDEVDDLLAARASLASPVPAAHHRFTWKVAWLNLLLLTISSICLSNLLIMGGVESNPGPVIDTDWFESDDNRAAQQEILDQLCAHAKDKNIRDLLRLYKHDRSHKELKKSLGSSKNSNDLLISTLKYLNVTEDQSQYTKPQLATNLITRIQNLLPDYCQICSSAYATDVNEKPLLTCAICGQGSHTNCITTQLGIDADVLDALTSDDVMNAINPNKFKGLHYLCYFCTKEHIPDPKSAPPTPTLDPITYLPKR